MNDDGTPSLDPGGAEERPDEGSSAPSAGDEGRVGLAGRIGARQASEPPGASRSLVPELTRREQRLNPDDLRGQRFIRSLFGYDRSEVRAYLRYVAEQLSEPETDLGSTFEGVSQEVGRILRNTNQVAAAIRKKLISDAERIRNEAREQLQRSGSEAQERADAILRRAEEQAARITEEAMSQADEAEAEVGTDATNGPAPEETELTRSDEPGEDETAGGDLAARVVELQEREQVLEDRLAQLQAHEKLLKERLMGLERVLNGVRARLDPAQVVVVDAVIEQMDETVDELQGTLETQPERDGS